MDIEFLTVILPYIITLMGGGGLGWVFTIRWTRKQEENNATKTSQEIYQSIITDMKTDRSRLVEEKEHLRAELVETRAELVETRSHLNRLDKKSNALEGQVQLVNRKLNAVLPFTCAIAPTCETKRKLTKQELWVDKVPDPSEVGNKVDSIHDAAGDDLEDMDQ